MIYQGIEIVLPEDNRTELQKIQTMYEGQIATVALLDAMRQHLRSLEDRDVAENLTSTDTFAAMNLIRTYICMTEDILYDRKGRSNVW